MLKKIICNTSLIALTSALVLSNAPIVQAKESDEDTTPEKNETVYVKVDGDGNTTKVIVSDELTNISDLSDIEDHSNLKDIENVKGDETFLQSGSSLKWESSGNDIYYQGTSDKALPVNTKVTYTLDGKTMKAADLKGKSGHLQIEYDYSLNLDEYTPFLMITALVLDADTTTNISVDNGKLVNDGDRILAVGFGFPGMKEELTSLDMDIPEGFTVEMDVTDYEPIQSITYATTSPLDTDDIDMDFDIDDLKSDLNELGNASTELVDGSKELKDGLDTLLSSSYDLQSGVSTLADGSSSLKDGTGKVNSGANTLKDGISTVNSSVNSTLLPGLKSLNDGVTGMQTELSEGITQLSDGVATLNTAMNTGSDTTPSVVSASSQIKDGTAALSAGINTAADYVSKAESSANALKADLTALMSNMSSASQNTTTTASVTSGASGYGVASGNATLKGDVTGEVSINGTASGEATLTGTVSGTGTIIYDGASQNVGAISTLQGITGLTEDQQAAVNSAIEALSAQQSVTADNMSVEGSLTGNVTLDNVPVSGQATIYDAELTGEVTIDGARVTDFESDDSYATMTADADGNIQQTAQTVNAETQKITDDLTGLLTNVGYLNAAMYGYTDESGTPQPGLKTSAATLAAGASQLDSGIQTVATGTSTLNTSVNGENGLVTKVNSGMTTLTNGTKALVDGGNTLSSGLNQLNSGASTLADGTSSLDSGAASLNDGIQTLKDGSNTLVDGVKQLDDGATELSDGMQQFDSEGIQELLNVFDGDLTDVFEDLQSLLDTDTTYNNYSGISEGMKGSVKFIFVSED